jgi:epoxyqueuosine reductase
MDTDTLWTSALAALAEAGWQARVVPVERLDDVRARVAEVLDSGELSPDAVEHLSAELAFELPREAPTPRSVVIGATARPLTQATLVVGGVEHHVPIPPHYAGYFTVPDGLTAALNDALAPAGHRALRCEPPLKTLAAGAGLARYGRNNIVYVDGLGSYLLLAASVTDAPPPGDAVWGPAEQLDRCEKCSACLRACPTGAIRPDRFLLETDRCLTYVNEDPDPFPDWVEPAWHTCAVGCLRCQQVCPEDATVDLIVAPPEVFDEAESAAILSGDPAARTPEMTARLAACGLDYSAGLIARNIRALIEG